MKFLAKITITVLVSVLLLVILALPFVSFAASRGISVKSKAGRPVKLYQDYAALVIGVSDYKHWPKLPGAIRDAMEVAATLKTMGFKVKLIKDPDSDTLKGLLNRLPYNLGKPRDRALLIYFAGHGATESLADGTKMGYIVPKDCPLPTVDPAGFADLGISMQSFESLARRIRCRHVLMAFDSCFSGSLFALGRAAPRDISEKIARPVRQFVTAGNENEEVPDQSTFKQVFIDGIGGEADYDRDGYVTGSELGMYLQKQVVNYTRGAQHPQFGKIRNPKLDKGDFVFLLAGGPGTAPAVKPPPPPPAPPKAPGTDELAALEEEAKRRKAWAAWQGRMDDTYWEKLSKLENSVLPPAKKASAWRAALAKFKDDNPFSTKDESLRKHARDRVGHWEGRAAESARAASKAGAKACPDCLAPPSGKRTCRADFSTRANGLTVRFQDESKDPDGIARAVAYSFGDGKVGYIQKGGVVSHSYAKEGSYPVTLRYKSGPTGKSYCYARKTVEVAPREPTPASGKRFTNSIGMTFVRIPAGRFMMGSKFSPEEVASRYGGKAKWYKREHPQHQVVISRSFYMQATEVTQAQWKAVMGTTPWSDKKYVKTNCLNCPAVYVSWKDAQDFIKKLNRREGARKYRYRLPTEAEWEYAARAGGTGAYCFGDDKGQLGVYAWYRNNAWDAGQKYAHAFGAKKPNRWGLYDMHGNVWEWVQDWYQQDYYSSSPKTDPLCKNNVSTFRVFRGGSWGRRAGGLRSADRGGNRPAHRSFGLGLRLALDTP